MLACALSTIARGGGFDVKVEKSELIIGHSCGMEAPCNARIGSIVYAFTQPAAAAITAGSGTAYVYIAASGVLTVGHSGLTIRCDRCTAAEGVKGFPADSVPLWTWTASGGKWDPGGLDRRAELARERVTGGSGLVTTESGGSTQLAVNAAVVPFRAGIPQKPTDACTEGSWAADRDHFYLCVAPDVWRRSTLATW